ncbi:hypothetical protein EGR_11225 [Echinococcus granulosus]|uniref:Uncharacterized protein n=1 Tax=Echinococcus granulosus TaxID=6210 RepID=W6TYW5_ECHGR|nr:hypothetical protein EGR_11225 [Echinococcus granulosus]EUB53918.1 hypothetical protein EGR_11225 [Echinococcus granulosus]
MLTKVTPGQTTTLKWLVVAEVINEVYKPFRGNNTSVVLQHALVPQNANQDWLYSNLVPLPSSTAKCHRRPLQTLCISEGKMTRVGFANSRSTISIFSSIEAKAHLLTNSLNRSSVCGRGHNNNNLGGGTDRR